jgi:hypothetical protein
MSHGLTKHECCIQFEALDRRDAYKNHRIAICVTRITHAKSASSRV